MSVLKQIPSQESCTSGQPGKECQGQRPESGVEPPSRAHENMKHDHGQKNAGRHFDEQAQPSPEPAEYCAPVGRGFLQSIDED